MFCFIVELILLFMDAKNIQMPIKRRLIDLTKVGKAEISNLLKKGQSWEARARI
jgi:hypothetical protein